MAIADSRLPKEKQFHVTTVPGLLGSMLVHLLFVAVVLKAAYLPVEKSDFVWVSLSNTVLQLAEPTAVLEQEEIETEHSAVEAKDLASSPSPEAIADVIDKPEKPENQGIAQSITIAPKVTQPKPPAPLKIKKTDKVKQKISQVVDSINVPKQANQTTEEPVRPKQVAVLTKNPIPVETKEISVAAQAGYLQANFNGIRNKVSDNLHYPTMARRQGWHGQVQVRFIILLSGEIDDLQIISSSGHSLLDRQALQAVKIAAPFPVPPVVASIIIPVTFELN